MSSSAQSKRSGDPVHPGCPHVGSYTGCVHKPAAAISSTTGCFFNVSQIWSFFRVRRVHKAIKKSKKHKNLAEKDVPVPSGIRCGKVTKKTRKEQEHVLCGTVKLGNRNFEFVSSLWEYECVTYVRKPRVVDFFRATLEDRFACCATSAVSPVLLLPHWSVSWIKNRVNHTNSFCWLQVGFSPGLLKVVEGFKGKHDFYDVYNCKSLNNSRKIIVGETQWKNLSCLHN